MFKIESYVTPILLSYVDKYVRDFKPADAQVSLWAGGVALHNLILKADVLQQEVSLPFTLISGRIHELLIQVPWTKIMSEPITVAIDTIECILSFRPPVCDENVMTETTSRTTQVVEAPPGYMQALVRRIVSNITVKVHHLIVKYVQDDVVLSLNVKHLTVESAGPDWKPAFADIDQNEPVIRRIVTLDDLTLCLDQSDDDGKIRFYQEPLLYRCQLSLKVLTKLVTAPVRRAKSINMQLSSSKLAWSITNEQLALILRLIKEHERFVAENNPIVFNKSATASTTGSQSSQTTSTEPHKDTSWSEWAWSWMPSWGGESTANDTPRMTPTHATHVYLSAYLDEICLIFKVMETEIGGRKRPRGMLELCADYLAFKSYVKRPVQVRAKFGLRNLLIKSHGKCTCGHMNSNTLNGIPTVYLKRRLSLPDADWNWPGDNLEDDKIDSEDIPQFEPKRKSGFSTDPDNRQSSSKPAAQTDVQETENKLEKKEPLQKEVVLEEKPDDTGGTKQVETPTDNKLIDNEETESDSAPQLNFARAGNLSDLVTSEPSKETKSEKYDPPKDLWHLMDPLVLVEYSHERGPPMYHQNPFENPPTDFEYSDWEEDCIIKVVVKPLDFRLCMGFIHRATTVFDIFDKVKMPTVDPLVRTLTVEECDALLDNLPQRRINVEITDFRIRLHPWDHLPVEKPLKLPIVLDLVVPKATCAINGPLYAHRVCSAACQIPQDSGPLWLGARQHITVALNSMLIQICPIDTDQPKPCARFDLRCVMHVLLFPEYFTQRQSVTFSYSAQIREINISGSAARLQAALQIVYSLLTQKGSLYLRQTSLAKDALNDEGEVVLDVTFEDIILRGYFTKFITSQMLTLQALRATVIHEHEGVSKQAWVVAGPDNPSSTAFFRCAFQWASEPMVTALDYLGIWVEPLALSLDPLFVQWLGYRPLIITQPESSSQPLLHKTISSSAYLNSRRRTTPPSSSGRGGSRTGSGQEQVHIRGRSIDSSSEPSEKKYAPKRNSKEKQQPGKQQLPWWKGERVLKLHSRLKHMLISIETGIILLYVTTTSVPAVNCPTVLLAMEQHASEDQQVLVFSLGRWSLHTNSTTKYLWQDVKHDGPTFIDAKTATEEESFPWKMKIADMSCYTFAAKVEPSPSDKAKGLKSQLKPTRAIQTITIVSLFTTSVTFSVLTKSLQYVVHNPKDQATSTKREPPKDEAVLKYFSSGVDFKPTSLMEFMRGPPKRSKAKEAEHEVKKEVKPGPVQREQIIMGPMVSIGFQWHADTPPILIKLDQEQLHIFSTSLHCIQHFITLLKFTPVRVPRYHGYSYLGFSSVRDVKVGVENPELDMLSESDEDSKSDLISIFESKPDQQDTTLKTFVWFQWVISRATLTVTSFQVKITVELDDIISTIDLQEHYNQFRMKIENFTILHHQRNEDDEWVVGPLYGRVVEVREPANAQEASHFLALTITQASLSNLPPSWKEELHPKLLDPKIMLSPSKAERQYCSLARHTGRPRRAVRGSSLLRKETRRMTLAASRPPPPHRTSAELTRRFVATRHTAYASPSCCRLRRAVRESRLLRKETNRLALAASRPSPPHRASAEPTRRFHGPAAPRSSGRAARSVRRRPAPRRRVKQD